MTTLSQSLRSAQKQLINTDTAMLDAELLLSSVLGCDRSYLFTWPDKSLTASQELDFEKLITRRVAGEPVAHLLGKKEFWSIILEVNASTLIPRPETELLVETALRKMPDTNCHVIDLGTGTGAVALALAKERPLWNITACDRSDEIVRLANRNAQSLALQNVTCKVSNWFDNIAEQGFDLVISNPPYVDATDAHLLQGDLCFEPHGALVSDNHGFSDIEKISHQALFHLKKDGWLMLEHGFTQALQVRNLFTTLGYISIETIFDLSGHERVTIGKFAGGKQYG